MLKTIEKTVASDVEGYTKTVKFAGLQIGGPRTIVNFGFVYTDAAGNKVIMANKQGRSVMINGTAPAGSQDEATVNALLTALESALEGIMDGL